MHRADPRDSYIAMTYPATLGLGLATPLASEFDLESLARAGDALGGILGTVIGLFGLLAIWSQLRQSKDQHADQFQKQANQHKAQALQDGIYRFAQLTVLRETGASYQEEKDLATALVTFQIWGDADLIRFTQQWISQYLDQRNSPPEPAGTLGDGPASTPTQANATKEYHGSAQQLLDQVNECIHRYLGDPTVPPKLQPFTVTWSGET